MNATLYQKAAFAAYENCLCLYDDAKVLHENKRYARAIALNVLACEEFAKSFLYKCLSCNLQLKTDIKKDLRDHELKMQHFAEIITFKFIYDTKLKEIRKAQSLDKQLNDPELRRTKLVIKNAFESPELAPIFDFCANAHQMKLIALYVSVEKPEIIEPKMLGKEQCQNIFLILSEVLYGFDAVLLETTENFSKFAFYFAPGVLEKFRTNHGKVKS